jgi:hypothetical protein
MRLVEFASAEEQLALWKLVSDNVWAAISKQAEDEAKQRAMKKAQAAKVPKRGGSAMAKPVMPPPPVKKPVPPPKPKLSAPKPQTKSAPPNQPPANLQQQPAGKTVGVQPIKPLDAEQATSPQRLLPFPQSAKKNLKSGVLAK